MDSDETAAYGETKGGAAALVAAALPTKKRKEDAEGLKASAASTSARCVRLPLLPQDSHINETKS